MLFKRQCELEAQGGSEGGFRREMRAAQAETQAEMEALNQQIRQAVATSNREFAKQERYCKEQREVLRALEDLAAREPKMYELDDAKDQIMSVCKVEVGHFTDRQLNRDLVVLCERVAAAKPRLPDGRRLIFTVGGSSSLSSDDHG